VDFHGFKLGIIFCNTQRMVDELADDLIAQGFSADRLHGGFALTHWNGSAAVEEQIKTDLKVTIRCIPFVDAPEAGTCPFTGEPSRQRVIWAKSY